MVDSNDNNTQIVKHCPFKVCEINRDFYFGGAAVALLGVGYWFFRCRGRKC